MNVYVYTHKHIQICVYDGGLYRIFVITELSLLVFVHGSRIKDLC